MESEPHLETTSLLDRQPSGIRALPSQDDDSDIDQFLENTISPVKFVKNDETNKNSTATSSSNTSSSSSSFTSGYNEGFVSGEEEFETPMAGKDDETLEKQVVIGENGAPGAGSLMGPSGIPAPVAGVPVAKISVDDDDDKNEVVVSEEDGHEVEDEVDGPIAVENAPRVRVFGEEDEEEVVENKDESLKNLGDEGIQQEPKVESLEEKMLDVDNGVASDVENKPLSPEIEEKSSLDSFSNEGDAVVDSISVDVGETLRSGVVVVGVEKPDDSRREISVIEEESTEVDCKTVEVDEEKNTNLGPSVSGGMKESDIELGNEEISVVEKSPSADSVAVDEGDHVVDSINVGVGEVVRSGVAVVGEIEEKDSGYTIPEVEDSVVEESSPLVEDSNVKESLPVSAMTTETDEVELPVEKDSVVDGIHVDVVEAVKSSVAVVGDSGVAGVEEEVKNGEKVMLGNEFEPLVSSNSSEVGNELDDRVESIADNNVENEVSANGAEIPQFVDHVDDETRANSVVVREETERDFPNDEEAKEGEKHVHPEEGDEESDTVFFGRSDEARQFIEELELASREAGSSRDQSERIDAQIMTDSEEEEADSDEEGEGKELFDSAALAALLKAATSGGSDSGPITITSQDGSPLFSVERPAGLGPSLRALRPTSRPNNSSLFTPTSRVAPSDETLSEEEKKKLENIHQLRVKFLRLVHRLGHTAEDSVAAQVLYRLALLSGKPTNPLFSVDNAKQRAMELEAEGKDDLDFSLNILVLGKSGVGKSATINSIFGEDKVKINAFEPGTTSVQEISGIVDGVKIRVIDAPGLRSSGVEQGFNRKILALVKKFTKRYPPDIMLYVDRLDSQTRDLNDLLMLKMISSTLGSSIWRSAIVTLTHGACAPPDGPSGSPLSYEVFVAQRSHIVQQCIGQAVGDLRLMNPSLMNPVSLVENHPACRKNREGQKVLPNGQAWRPQLLLLCYSLKILSEANSTSKPQDPFDQRKLFGFRVRSPPLPYLLSSLLQPRVHPKLSADQGGDIGDSDIDLDDLSDSDQEGEEDEYDQLPPFKPLRKSQIAKLSRDQRKAYFEEYDYRVKLLQKKQFKEELKRMKEMKKKGESGGVGDYGENPEDFDPENGAPAAVPVPLPDMVLPPSFDSDNPAYRYRFLEPTSQFLARPVLDTHGWDHDCGYDGVNVEQNLGIAGRYPAAIAVQVTKDKKEFNIHLDSALSAKHGENGSSLVGFDVQTIGKQLAYILKGDTKFKNLKKNKTAAGISVTFLGENVATGVKLEDQITLGKRLVFVGSTGTVRSQKDAAYGANLEVRLREADYPIGQDQSSFVLSLMKWRGDLAVGANLQSQFSVGRNSKMAVRVSLNNKLSGQISVRTSSSDHLQLALAGLIPIAVSIYRSLKPGGVSENYSIY